jgi:hypothetical protein
MDSKWENQEYAYLKRKKGDYPRHREIGDKMEIKEVILNPKYNRIRFYGFKSRSDYFDLHESYLMTESEMRDKNIDNLLDNIENQNIYINKNVSIIKQEELL